MALEPSNRDLLLLALELCDTPERTAAFIVLLRQGARYDPPIGYAELLTAGVRLLGGVRAGGYATSRRVALSP